MPRCPLCNTAGAYVGFSSIECRNPECTHYVQAMEALCPCCGIAGHVPSEEPVDSTVQADYVDTSIPGVAVNPGYGSTGYGEAAAYHVDPAHYGADPSIPAYSPPAGQGIPDGLLSQDPLTQDDPS
jgi:hypothetical protein